MSALPQKWLEFDGPLSVYSHVGVTGPEYAVQALFKFPNGYEISVVRNKLSLGHLQDLFEMALFQGNYFVNMVEYIPPEFKKRLSNDYQLLGWLTEDEVAEILKFAMTKFNITVTENA